MTPCGWLQALARCRYGLVYPGIGWVIWRSKEYLPEAMVFHTCEPLAPGGS